MSASALGARDVLFDDGEANPVDHGFAASEDASGSVGEEMTDRVSLQHFEHSLSENTKPALSPVWWSVELTPHRSHLTRVPTIAHR